MSPKISNNNQISIKLAKPQNQFKSSKVANSPTVLSTSTLSTKSSQLLLPSSPVWPMSSSSSSAKVVTTKKLTTSEAFATEPTTEITLKSMPIKMDRHSILSFASVSVSPSSTSISKSASTSMEGKLAMKEKIMSYKNVVALLTLLCLFCGVAGVDGLKCYMCGQYNEGVGSITPCLNYSKEYAHLYLKDCLKKTEKFCVKYVSELSTVRDCATECAEKEVWETKTHCCNTDGCNGAGNLEGSMELILMPAFYLMYKAIKPMLRGLH